MNLFYRHNWPVDEANSPTGITNQFTTPGVGTYGGSATGTMDACGYCMAPEGNIKSIWNASQITSLKISRISVRKEYLIN